MTRPLHRQQFALLLLTAVFTCCVAPNCFSCTQDEQGCGDHFGLPNTAADFCDGTCVKKRGERYSNSVRYVEVTRMCTEQTSEGCHGEKWNGINVEACTCNTDYCNTAARTGSSRHVAHVFSMLAAVWTCIHL